MGKTCKHHVQWEPRTSSLGPTQIVQKSGDAHHLKNPHPLATYARLSNTSAGYRCPPRTEIN